MVGKEFRKVLSSGGKVFGMALEGIGNPRQLSIYLDAGVDFIFIDNEHNPLDRSQTAFACNMIAKAGIAPIVRIPKPDAYLATMAIDGGAQGIIAPYVESVEEVLDIISAVKYRPLKGKALKDLIATGKYPSEESKEYIGRFNDNGIVVIMIESVAGFENIDKILGIRGVDAILIGPNDFSISLGVPDMYDHPVFINAAKTVMKKTLQAGVGFGIHFPTLDLHKYWTSIGQNLVVYSTETYIASQYIKKGLDELRNIGSEGLAERVI